MKLHSEKTYTYIYTYISQFDQTIFRQHVNNVQNEHKLKSLSLQIMNITSTGLDYVYQQLLRMSH